MAIETYQTRIAFGQLGKLEKLVARQGTKVRRINARREKQSLALLQIPAISIGEIEATRDDAEMLRDVNVIITYERPEQSGWSFVAVLQHDRRAENDGVNNIVRLLDSVPMDSIRTLYSGKPKLARYGVPECLETLPPACSQCGHLKRRKETYLIRHENGSWEQIGTTCISGFFGGLNVSDIVCKATMPHILRKATANCRVRGERYEKAYALDCFIAAIVSGGYWLESPTSTPDKTTARRMGKVESYLAALPDTFDNRNAQRAWQRGKDTGVTRKLAAHIARIYRAVARQQRRDDNVPTVESNGDDIVVAKSFAFRSGKGICVHYRHGGRYLVEFRSGFNLKRPAIGSIADFAGYSITDTQDYRGLTQEIIKPIFETIESKPAASIDSAVALAEKQVTTQDKAVASAEERAAKHMQRTRLLKHLSNVVSDDVSRLLLRVRNNPSAQPPASELQALLFTLAGRWVTDNGETSEVTKITLQAARKRISAVRAARWDEMHAENTRQARIFAQVERERRAAEHAARRRANLTGRSATHRENIERLTRPIIGTPVSASKPIEDTDEIAERFKRLDIGHPTGATEETKATEETTERFGRLDLN